MAKPKTKKQPAAFDGVYLLKIALYVILGSLWIKVDHSGSGVSIPLPVGLVIGLLFTTHEHFRIDRKIEYGVLVLATLFGLIAPYGLFITI